MNKTLVTPIRGAALRSADLSPAHPAVALGAACVDAVLGGLQLGALHEVFAKSEAGAGAASGFAAGLALRAGARRPLLWVRPDFAAQNYGALSGPGLIELGLDPARFILVHAPDALAALRVAQDGLSCAALGAVIAEIYGAPKILDLTATRRLGLAAAKTGVTGFLLRHPATPQPSAAETRWLIAQAVSGAFPGEVDTGSPSGNATNQRASHERSEALWGWPRFAATLFRNRSPGIGGGTGQFVLEWRDGLFHDATTTHGTADSGAVVSAPADRSAATPLRRRA